MAKAIAAEIAIPITIGFGAPLAKMPDTAITAAPTTNCNAPISAEAVPAIAP